MGARAELQQSQERKAHLQETVISTLVAGMFPVIGSKSYTEDMSSSLSITSPPCIVSTGRARAPGSGVTREAHSLLLAAEERDASPETPPGSRSETRRPPVRQGEAATSQTLKLKKVGGVGGGSEGGSTRNQK